MHTLFQKERKEREREKKITLLLLIILRAKNVHKNIFKHITHFSARFKDVLSLVTVSIYRPDMVVHQLTCQIFTSPFSSQVVTFVTPPSHLIQKRKVRLCVADPRAKGRNITFKCA